MSIRINSFGGIGIWFLRKKASYITSRLALEIADKRYARNVQQYVKRFQEKEIPVFRMVNIETVNRCNGKCAFCPANIYEEKREYKTMSETLFHKIIMELKALNWKGQIFLNINNEPLIDKKISERAAFVKKQLGNNVIVSMFTNGSLLTEERLMSLVGGVDELIINNYSEKYKLNDNISRVYRFVKKNSEKFKDIRIIVNRRYSQEILSTRAGNAPNKKRRNNHVTSTCIYPYTDITIFPDGKVGLCCNDCFEVTDYGNVNEMSLLNIWQGEKFSMVRQAMLQGRLNVPFCAECDVVDSGFREKLIKLKL